MVSVNSNDSAPFRVAGNDEAGFSHIQSVICFCAGFRVVRFNAFLLQSYEKAGNLQNKSPDILGGLNKLSKLNKRFFEREAGAISFIYYN